MAERTLSTTRLGVGTGRGWPRLLAVGSLVGVVAGMGSFMFINDQLMPWGVSNAWALAIIGLAGAYTHLLAIDLSESITLSLVAVVAGFAVHVGAWVSPLWVLSYPPAARDVLLPRMLGEAVAGGLLIYVLTFYGSYFGAIFLASYVEA